MAGKSRSVPINTGRIRKMIDELGLTLAEMDRALGLGKNAISKDLYRGLMAEETLKGLALYLRVTPDVLTAPEEEKPETGGNKSEAQSVSPLSLQKIEQWLEQLIILETDTNQKLAAMTELIRGSISDWKEMEDAQRNYFVTVNQHLNKIHNQMKYGGR